MSPRDTQNAFDELIIEGVNITRAAQEGDALYHDVIHLHETFARYQIWRAAIKEFLTKANRDTAEWHKFYEANSVPYMKGGIEYGDIASEKSQTLLKNMRIETSKTLELLDEVGGTLFDKNRSQKTIPNSDVVTIQGKKDTLVFNTITGDTTLNKISTTFSPGTQKFNILLTLVTSKEYQASYIALCSALKFENTKSKRADIQQVVKTMKEDLHILPKKKGSDRDIFVSIDKFGFRIIVE